MNTRWRLVVAESSALLYAVSLLLPTAAPFKPEYSDTTYPGYFAFGAGTAFLDWDSREIDCWLLGAAWLANPAIWIAILLVLTGRWRAAGLAAGCGVLLGLVVLPRWHLVIGALPGYWTWLGSAALLLAVSVCVLVGEYRRHPT